ncbi:uncharacterized protein An05g00860 [Aspergillus niger]|uniref:Contig An05c0040, genomic contig n=2 Tax=Aspergillus niger TaxID=5061 RepID=A2QKP0_ASPNC|nr:uncharacterized protein An05g00860 [Aspergillus niger]CAK39123.1 unnamed protein product [Aspergillus niger]
MPWGSKLETTTTPTGLHREVDPSTDFLLSSLTARTCRSAALPGIVVPRRRRGSGGSRSARNIHTNYLILTLIQKKRKRESWICSTIGKCRREEDESGINGRGSWEAARPRQDISARPAS